jgi:hypothetical protein
MFKLKRNKKFTIPLRFFEKLNVLLPAQAKYLESYHNKVKNSTKPINSILLEKIGTILKKPHIKDIIYSYDYTVKPHYSEGHYRKIKKLTKETIAKFNFWQKTKKLLENLIANIMLYFMRKIK